MVKFMTTFQITPLTDLSECCSLGSGPLTSGEADRYAKLFKVLSEPARLLILSQLAASGCGPVTVNDLTEKVGLSQPTVSHHLRRLTEAGLLNRVQEGRAVIHSVRPELFAELRSVLQME